MQTITRCRKKLLHLYFISSILTVPGEKVAHFCLAPTAFWPRRLYKWSDPTWRIPLARPSEVTPTFYSATGQEKPVTTEITILRRQPYTQPPRSPIAFNGAYSQENKNRGATRTCPNTLSTIHKHTKLAWTPPGCWQWTLVWRIYLSLLAWARCSGCAKLKSFFILKPIAIANGCHLGAPLNPMPSYYIIEMCSGTCEKKQVQGGALPHSRGRAHISPGCMAFHFFTCRALHSIFSLFIPKNKEAPQCEMASVEHLAGLPKTKAAEIQQ